MFGSLRLEATFKVGDAQYTIARSGFWKPVISIEDSTGIRIAEFKPEKWYSTNCKGIFEKRKLTIEIRNKHLVEYVIKEYGQDILVSGLDTNNNKAILKITTKENVKNELIFDALL